MNHRPPPPPLKPGEKRTKVTVTLTFSLLEAKNEPGRVTFRVGPWTYYRETPKQAQKLITKQLRMRVVDP